MAFVFNETNGKFLIKGHLIFVNITEEEVLAKVKAYSLKSAPKTSFHFQVHYIEGRRAMNLISDIYHLLNHLTNFTMYWEYEPEDEDGKQLGEDLIEELNIPFVLKVIEYPF